MLSNLMFFSVSNRNESKKRVRFNCLRAVQNRCTSIEIDAFLFNLGKAKLKIPDPCGYRYLHPYIIGIDLKTIIIQLSVMSMYVYIYHIHTHTKIYRYVYIYSHLKGCRCYVFSKTLLEFQHPHMQLRCHHSLHQVVFQEFLSCDLIWAQLLAARFKRGCFETASKMG